jgi:hypothetical protein
VDAIGRRTDLDQSLLDGVEHGIRAAGEVLESTEAFR